MKNYVIEVGATFTIKANSIEEAEDVVNDFIEGDWDVPLKAVVSIRDIIESEDKDDFDTIAQFKDNYGKIDG